MKKTVVLLSAFLFWISQPVGPGTTSAWVQEIKERPTLQHQMTVTLKLIQVTVTDKKGNPITDLGKEDFIVSDNGEERKITELRGTPCPCRFPKPPSSNTGQLCRRRSLSWAGNSSSSSTRPRRRERLSYCQRRRPTFHPERYPAGGRSRRRLFFRGGNLRVHEPSQGSCGVLAAVEALSPAI